MRRTKRRGDLSPKGSRTPKVRVLLSGGIDSTACLAFYVGRGYTVDAMFADYGQPVAAPEHGAAVAVAKYYRVPLKCVTLGGASAKGPGLILGRNAYLLFTALMNALDPPSVIATGIHRGTNYYDCSAEFLKSINTILTGYTDGTVLAVAPFLKWKKAAIWRYSKQIGVPIDLTYSCEVGPTAPCGRCISCLDRRALHAL